MRIMLFLIKSLLPRYRVRQVSQAKLLEYHKANFPQQQSAGSLTEIGLSSVKDAFMDQDLFIKREHL